MLEIYQAIAGEYLANIEAQKHPEGGFRIVRNNRVICGQVSQKVAQLLLALSVGDIVIDYPADPEANVAFAAASEAERLQYVLEAYGPQLKKSAREDLEARLATEASIGAVVVSDG